MPPIRSTRPFLLAVFLTTPALAQPTFTPIGDFPGGEDFSTLWAVSGNGQVAVGASNSTLSMFNDDAVRFNRPLGPLTELVPGNNDLPGGSYRSTAYAASLDGSVIVGASAYNGVRTHAFRVSGGVMTGLGNIANQTPPLPAANDISRALAVSDNGSVIVGSGVRSTTLQNEAAIWSGSNPGFGLGDLPGGDQLSVANGVSWMGSVVVGEGRSAAGREAFIWTSTALMRGLGDDPGGGFDSSARDVIGENTPFAVNGTAIVGYVTTAAGREAALWSVALNGPTVTISLQALGDLPGGAVASEANAVANNRVIVGTADAGRTVEVIPGLFVPVPEAFIWDPTSSMRRLADVLGPAIPAGWVLNTASGISNDGTVIVGEGTDPAGVTRGYIVTLPPPCRADFNGMGGVTVQDIFDFLSAYFANSPAADFDGLGGVTVQDIFDFLSAYFAGC